MGDVKPPREPYLPDSDALTRDPSFIEFAAQVLGNAEIAEGLSREQMATLAATGQVRNYAANELICDEHERSDEVYIIESGSVEVWLNPASIGEANVPPRRIAVLQAGQTCGELALLDGGVRSAQLRAGAGGVKLMAFSSYDMLALCEADTTIGFRVMRNLASGLALRLRLQDMRLYSASE